MNGTRGMNTDKNVDAPCGEVEGECAMTHRATFRVIVVSAWQADGS